MPRELPPLRKLIAAAALSGAAALGAPAFAAAAPMTFTVDNLDGGPSASGCNLTPGDGDCTLADAIAAAEANDGDDTVVFDSSITGAGSTIDVTATLPIDAGGDGLIIDGPGPNQLELSRVGVGRIMTVGPGAAPITLDGLTFSGGTVDASTSPNAAGGGAIYSEADSIGVSDSTFTGNTTTGFGDAADGGAIAVRGGYLGVGDSTFTGNATTGRRPAGEPAGASGGAISVEDDGGLFVTDSTFEANATEGRESGGGALSVDGRLEVSGSTFEGNSTEGILSSGGAINNRTDDVGITFIKDSDFLGNSTLEDRAEGGAIYRAGGQLGMPRVTLTGNHTAGYRGYGGAVRFEGVVFALTDTTASDNYTEGQDSDGGALSVFGDASTTSNPNTGLFLTRSTLSGNYTAGDISAGGAVSNAYGRTTTENSTLHDNTSEMGSGGAVHNRNVISDIKSTTIAGNTAATGPGGFYSNSAIDVTNSIIAGNTGGDIRSDFGGGEVTYTLIGEHPAGSGLDTSSDTNIVGTFSEDADPELGPLQDNGGPTLTMAPNPSSPVIDAGDFEPRIPRDGPIDQRGFARPQGEGDDMGAFELDQEAPSVQIDAVGTTADSTPDITFTSPDDDVASFECSLDDAEFKACESPLTPGQPLSNGQHTVRVRATDTSGNLGVADSETFTVEVPVEPTPTDPGEPDPGPASPDPGPSNPDPTGPTEPPGDTVITDLDVTAKKSQRQKGKKIKIKISVSAQENITAKGSGKIKVKKPKKARYRLKPQAKKVQGGERTIIKLKPKSKKDAKKVRKAIKKWKKASRKRKKKLAVKTPVKVVAFDEAGNKQVEKRVVTLK